MVAETLEEREKRYERIYELEEIDVGAEGLESLIANHDLKYIKTKIDKSNFQKPDERHRFALYFATIHKRIDVLEYLFELGSDFSEAEANRFNTPMTSILLAESTEVLFCYLNHGYKYIPSQLDDAVLCSAVHKGSLEFIELLVKIGVPVTDLQRDNDGTTSNAIEIAMIDEREYEIIEFLAEAGCSFSSSGDDSFFAFNIIFRSYDAQTKRKLFDLLKRFNKFDPNVKDGQGNSLIWSAISSSDSVSVKELIIAGADFSHKMGWINRLLDSEDMEEIAGVIDAKGGDIGEFLSLLPYSSVKNYLETREKLTSDSTAYQILTNTKLSIEKKAELLDLAIQKGADIEFIPNKPENLLIYYTQRHTHGAPLDIAKLLLKNGARIETDKQSALLEALFYYHIPLVELYLDHGADVNYIDVLKDGAINKFFKLHTTLNTTQKRKSTLELLLDNGLDLNQKVNYKSLEQQKQEYSQKKIIVKEREEWEKKLYSFFSIFALERESELIEMVLDRGIVIDDEDAIFYGIALLENDDLVKKLIQTNPYYEKSDFYEIDDGFKEANILQLAIESSKIGIVEYILETYPDLAVSSVWYPTLSSAIKNEKFSIQLLEKLIKKESDLDRYYHFEDEEDNLDYEETLLLSVVQEASKSKGDNRFYKITKLLLENGASVELPTKLLNRSDDLINEYSVFIEAINERGINKELYDLLYQFGGSLTKPTSNFNEMPIHTIIQRRVEDEDVALGYLEYCFEKGSFDLEYENIHGATIFLGAAMACLPKVLEYLAKKGSNIHIVGGHDNAPALHKAISNYNHIETSQRLRTVQTLLSLGCKMEQFDSDQMTPLMCAASVGTFQVVKELIEKGARADNTNGSGVNAIHHAINGNSCYDEPDKFQSVKSKIIEKLVKNGANIDQVVSGGKTALIYAINGGYREIFTILIKLKADINIACDDGYLPLYYAMVHEDQYFINRLNENENLQLDKLDSFGRTIVHQILQLNYDFDILQEMIENLVIMDMDLNLGEEPPLLFYLNNIFENKKEQMGFIKKGLQLSQAEQRRVKLLIENGADKELAIDIAEQKNYPTQLIQYLKDRK